MKAFHRILILAFGLALSFNARSQNQLDPADTTDCYFKCLKKYLLTPERKCGIIIAPSFTNLFGISLSPDYDMLTLIEMKNPYFSQLNDSDDEDDEDDEEEEDDEDEDEEDVKENNDEEALEECYSYNKTFELTDRNFPVRKLAIDPVNGKRLSELLDIAVEKPKHYYSRGLDGTRYYFCASNGITGKTWSPRKHSNCAKFVGVVSKLVEAIQNNTPDSLDNKLWSEIDSLSTAFKNDPVTKFLYVKWIEDNKDGIPSVKFHSEGDPYDGPYFDANMTVPADFRPGSTKEDLSRILNDREIESTFIDFSTSLKRWNEKPAKIYVEANITIDDSGKESYEVKIAEKGYAILNFTLPLSKFSLENLIEQEDLCLKKFVEEKEAAKAAASSPK